MKHRLFLLAYDSDPKARPFVVSLFQQFGNGGTEAESHNCTTPLAKANAPTVPIAKCCSTVIGDATLAALLPLPKPAGLLYVVCDELGENEGIITHASPGYETFIGLTWDLPTTLQVLGLVFLEVPSDTPLTPK